MNRRQWYSSAVTPLVGIWRGQDGHDSCTAVEWYRTFGKVFLESVPVADRAAFLDDYRTACARRLGGENRLDFVRLRWRAVRRDDRSR